MITPILKTANDMATWIATLEEAACAMKAQGVTTHKHINRVLDLDRYARERAETDEETSRHFDFVTYEAADGGLWTEYEGTAGGLWPLVLVDARYATLGAMARRLRVRGINARMVTTGDAGQTPAVEIGGDADALVWIEPSGSWESTLAWAAIPEPVNPDGGHDWADHVATFGHAVSDEYRWGPA